MYTNMVLHTTYNTEQTAKMDNTLEQNRFCDTIIVLYHTFLVRPHDKDKYTVLSTTVKTQTFNIH